MAKRVGNVRVNLKRLQRFKQVMSTFSGHPEIEKAIKQWAYLYRGFAMRRFDKASKGDGTWPPLSPVTIAGRRKGKQKKIRIAKAHGGEDKRFKKRPVLSEATILRDTGLLFLALSPTWAGRPGAVQTRIPFGIRVGFGGPGRHGKGNATIADIARAHQFGGPRLPKREIIVKPDQQCIAQMRNVMQAAVNKIAKAP